MLKSRRQHQIATAAGRQGLPGVNPIAQEVLDSAFAGFAHQHLWRIVFGETLLQAHRLQGGQQDLPYPLHWHGVINGDLHLVARPHRRAGDVDDFFLTQDRIGHHHRRAIFAVQPGAAPADFIDLPHGASLARAGGHDHPVTNRKVVVKIHCQPREHVRQQASQRKPQHHAPGRQGGQKSGDGLMKNYGGNADDGDDVNKQRAEILEHTWHRTPHRPHQHAIPEKPAQNAVHQRRPHQPDQDSRAHQQVFGVSGAYAQKHMQVFRIVGTRLNFQVSDDHCPVVDDLKQRCEKDEPGYERLGAHGFCPT